MAGRLRQGQLRRSHCKNERRAREESKRAKGRAEGLAPKGRAIPQGIDWMVWRILMSEQFSVPSPDTILSGWTLEEVLDAHELLDLVEEISREATKSKAKKTG